MKNILTILVFLGYLEVSCQINIVKKFIFIDNRTEERIKFLSVEVNFFQKNLLMKSRTHLTDINGLLVIDNLIADSLSFIIDPQYEYCSFKQSTKQLIKVKNLNLLDTSFIRVNYFESEINNNFLFYFQPFTTECINITNEKYKLKSCYCLYNDKCDFLLPAFELLKCNQNLVVELISNCTEKEYTECADSLIIKRIELIRSVILNNGITDSRVFISNYGKSKPRVDIKMYKNAKSYHEKTLLETNDTYVRIYVKNREQK